jgi:3-isopropylmalate dehydrogenase
MTSQTVLLLPGDGIGPEVMAQARRVAEILVPDLKFETGLVGGASFDRHGEPLTEDTLEKALHADAVLLGAVGGPKWTDVARNKRPEAGLLALRKGLDVFANLRPAYCFPALVDASSLKREIIEGLDLMIVRELTGDVYFGQPRGIDIDDEGYRRGYDTAVYTHPEIERVTRVAFDIARGRTGRVCSVEKSNVMESGLFWRQEVTLAHAEYGGGIDLIHMYAPWNWCARQSNSTSSSQATCSAISCRMRPRC